MNLRRYTVYIPNSVSEVSSFVSNHEIKQYSEAEFKEFERRLKFKPWIKYGWFHLKLYSMFQDLSGRLIETKIWRI